MSQPSSEANLAHLDLEVKAIVQKLQLEPHPEGGFFRETQRSQLTLPGGRSIATLIYFLLPAGSRSHWHTVDAEETWLWHAGSPLNLHHAAADGKSKPDPVIRLGPDVLNDEVPQYIYGKGAWQSAEANDGWALVSCSVTPGFDFDGFKMAEEGWEPGRGTTA